MAFIIDTPDLRKYTTMSEFKDVDKLKVIIDKIDYFAVQKLLGIPLYEHLMAGTLNHQQAFLKVLVKKYAAYLVHHDTIMDSTFRTGDRGNVQDGQSAEITAVKYLRQKLNSEIEQLKADILAYIEGNRDSFKDFWNFVEAPKCSSKYYSAILFD